MLGNLRHSKGKRKWAMFCTSDNLRFKTWEIGEEIGGEWRVIQLYRGGFGVVYIATNRSLSEENPELPSIFALKTFRPDMFEGPATVKDFEREAFVWINLGVHDHIINAISYEKYGNAPFVVCEAIVNDYAPNTLHGWLLNRRIEIPHALFFGAQICVGMEYAFSRGVEVHSDLKPDNIFITDSGLLKIGDWGLSRLGAAGMVQAITGEAGSHFYSQHEDAIEQSLRGTLPYVAPEVLSRAAPPSVASDIYAFGVILYEALGGRLPVQASTTMQWIEAHASKPIEPLQRLQSSIPRSVDDLVRACLAKEPWKRPSSFSELKVELATLLKKEAQINLPDFLLDAQPGTAADDIPRISMALHRLGAEEEAQALWSHLPANEGEPSVVLYDHKDSGWQLSIPPEIISRIEKDAETDRKDPGNLVLMGLTYKVAKRFDDARRVFRQVADLYPNMANEVEAHLQSVDELEFENHITNGHAHNQRGETAAALQAFEAAAEIDGSGAIVWYNIGNVLLQMGEITRAKNALSKATTIDPRFYQAWNILGAALAQMEELDEALMCFNKAIQIDPTSPKPWLNRGGILMLQGHREEALQSIRKALEIDPDYEQAQYAFKVYSQM